MSRRREQPVSQQVRWVLRHRAWSRYHLVRYWRLAKFRAAHPDVIVEGPVFLGKRVQVEVRRGYGRLILGAYSHLGDDCRIRAHEGTVRIGAKTVLGRDVTVNAYLSVTIGASCLVADSAYICDFDHETADIHVPIKDQGLVKAPVRIGDDTWIGTKAVITSGTQIGCGCVIGAGAVARGTFPDLSVAGGVPARVVKDREQAYAEAADVRAYLAGLDRGTLDEFERAVGSRNQPETFGVPMGNIAGTDQEGDR